MEENLTPDWTVDTLPTWFETAKHDQKAYKTANGKYQFHARDSYATDCEVHEYVTPTGEVGYVVYQYEDRSGVTYMRASGKGTEGDFYHDWKKMLAAGEK